MGGTRTGAPRLNVEKVDDARSPGSKSGWARYAIFAGSTELAHVAGSDNYVILSWPGNLRRGVWQPESVVELARAALPVQTHGLTDAAVKDHAEMSAFLRSARATRAISDRKLGTDGLPKLDWDLKDARDVAVYRALLLSQDIDCYRLDVSMDGARGAVICYPTGDVEQDVSASETLSLIAIEHDPHRVWDVKALEFLTHNHESSIARDVNLSQLAFSLTMASRLIAAQVHSLDPSALV